METKSLLTTSEKDFHINLLKSKLNEAGIESWVLNKRDSSYMTFGEIELYVDNENLEKARQVLGNSIEES